MILTKRARRIVAVLAVPAFLLSAAACGSEEPGSSDDSSPEGPAVTVSGDAGQEPEITIKDGAEFGAETVIDVIHEGDGVAIEEGDWLRVDVIGRVSGNGMELINTWPDEQAEGEAQHQQFVIQAGIESSLPQAATAPLVGTTSGSRVQVQGQVESMLGPGAEEAGLAKDDGVVWVFDIAAAANIDAKGEAEGEQAEVEEGLPGVEAGNQEPATFTIPEGEDPPAELQEQVLIEGEGDEVAAGQGLVVQYTGVTWATGEKFDSSWDRDSAAGFQIGTGSVVDGWDQGLVGKHVGDRVLLVIPPDLGYGEEEAGNGAIPPGSTLVFVVDILGTV